MWAEGLGGLDVHSHHVVYHPPTQPPFSPQEKLSLQGTVAPRGSARKGTSLVSGLKLPEVLDSALRRETAVVGADGYLGSSLPP